LSELFREHLIEALGTNYTLDRELTGGGMSRVFVATEHALNRTVVVKVLRPELAADVNRERFRREIMLAAQLQHPLIVTVLSAGEHKDLLWYTMPFVEGESLREEIRRGPPANARNAIRVLHDVLDALSYAHARGVIHRDIKPGNILRHGNHSLVTDFGVAKALSAALPTSGQTSAGIAIGTPAYMAPEQLAADPSANHRIDIYATGLLIYELLTGQQAFAESSPQATMAAQLTQMPRDLAQARPDIPPALSALITRMLAKNPNDRPQSATAALEELDAIVTPTGTVARLPTPATPRRRSFLLAAGIALVALIALGVLFQDRLRQPLASRASTDSVRRDSIDTAAKQAAALAAQTAALAKAAAELERQPRAPGSTKGSGSGGGSGTTRVADTRIAPTAGSGSGGGSKTAPSALKTAPVTSTNTKTKSPAGSSRSAPAPTVALLNRKVALLPFRDATNRPALAVALQAVQDSVQKSLAAAGYTLASDSELLRLVTQQNQGGGLRRLADAGGIGAVVMVDVVARADEINAVVQVLDVWRNQTSSAREAADLDKPLELASVGRPVVRALDRVSWRTRTDPKRVLVFDVDNQTGIDTMLAVTRQLEDTLKAAVVRYGAQVVTLDSAMRASRDVSERRQYGVRRGAGALVAASIMRVRADSVMLRLSVRDMSEERTFPNVEGRVHVSAVPAAMGVLATRLLEQLGQVNWGPKVSQ
jgi:serine/threonine protein kinase